MDAGAAELDRWLDDLLHAGLADAAARPRATYDQMAARLVDAQAPGLARAVRDLGALPSRARDWPERMLVRIGQLTLLLAAWQRRETLDPALEAEVLTQLGVSETRAAVLATPAVTDTWAVLGRRVVDTERMRVRRTWLWGPANRRWALLLEFDLNDGPWPSDFVPGMAGRAALSFYPGTAPQRAIAHDPPTAPTAVAELPALPMGAALDAYAAALGDNPWVDRRPLAVRAVVPARRADGTWFVTAADGQQLRLAGPHGWEVHACAGGRPIDLCGEWDGFALNPLSARAPDATTLALFGAYA
jgi:hypothetical protein